MFCLRGFLVEFVIFGFREVFPYRITFILKHMKFEHEKILRINDIYNVHSNQEIKDIIDPLKYRKATAWLNGLLNYDAVENSEYPLY